MWLGIINCIVIYNSISSCSRCNNVIISCCVINCYYICDSIVVISNSIIMYIEVMLEYISCYVINSISNVDMISIVSCCECIVLLVVSIWYIIYDVWCNDLLDGLMYDNNVDSNSVYICILICCVSNIIICMWYNVNIYGYVCDYCDMYCYIIWLVFIELQIKEYIYYNCYINEDINVSISYILLGIHCLHIVNWIVIVSVCMILLIVKCCMLLYMYMCMDGDVVSVFVYIYCSIVSNYYNVICMLLW